jgi:hypothetical protein
MKILLFIVMVALIWRIVGWIEKASRPPARPRVSRPAAERVMRTTDTVVCPKCGAYVPADRPTACNRGDCPFPRIG